MENASKAIIMAGAILISTLIVSIMIYLFAVFGGFSRDMSTKISGEKITQFNNNFEKYEGRINITAQEIVSIINFAKEFNEENDLKYDNDDSIKIYVHPGKWTSSSTTESEFFKYCHRLGKDESTVANEFINYSTDNYLIYRCRAKIEKCEDYSSNPPTDDKEHTIGIKYNMTSNNDNEVKTQNGGCVDPGKDIIREIHFFIANCNADSNVTHTNDVGIAKNCLYNLHTREKCKWLER